MLALSGRLHRMSIAAIHSEWLGDKAAAYQVKALVLGHMSYFM